MITKKRTGFYEPGNGAFDEYIQSYVQEKHITYEELEYNIKELEDKHIRQLKQMTIDKEVIKVMRLVLQRKKDLAQLQITIHQN